MNCPYCSTANPDGAKFCNECGKPLAVRISSTDFPDPLNPAKPVAEIPTASLPRVESIRSARNAAAALSGAQAASEAGFEDVLPEIGDPYLEDAFDGDAFVDEPYANQADTQVLPIGYQPARASVWDVESTMEMPTITDDPEAALAASEFFSAPDSDEQIASKRPRKTVLTVLLVIAILAAAVAGVTYYFELWGGIRVPDVAGLSEAEALDVLQEKGFSVRSMQVKSDDTEGKVILSDPKGGDRARKGGEVVIHVATPRTIPDIVGKTEAEAQALLKDAGYENVTFQNEKSNEEEGTILSVSPEAGTKVKGAAPVTVVVAEAYTVPDVSGMDEQSAIAAIQNAGYYAHVSYEYSETETEGQVLGTEPGAGSKFPSESTVVLKVVKSRAHELVEIMHGILYEGATATIGGTSYYIHSIEGIEFAGDDTVNFTIVGQAFTYLDGETVYGSTKTISGSAHFDASNNYTM